MVILLFIFQVFAFCYVKPFVINELNLNQKEAWLIVLLCYISLTFGLITMFTLHALERRKEMTKD